MTLFASLRVRNYRLFASGQIVSLTGTWMQRVAQDWLVLTLSNNSGTALGITTSLQFLPMLLFSMFGGVLADRYSKRRLLIMSQAASGVTALALALLDLGGVVALWHVYLLAFALGVASALDTPVRQAFVSELVGQEQLTNAIALNSATFNTARIIGPAVAGVLIGTVGTGWVFLLNAGSYLAVIAVLAVMRDGELFVGKRVERAPGQIRAALAYVRVRPHLLLPIVLAGVVGTFGFNFQMTTALLAKSTFHRSASGYGLLSTLLAVGSLGGALMAARRRQVRHRLLITSSIVFGLLTLACGLMPTYASFAVMLVPTGVAALTFATAANTSVQLGSSPAMRGRVMALYLLVFIGGTPVGAPLIGWIAEQLGPRSSLIIGGSVSAVAGVVVALVLARTSHVTMTARLRPRPALSVRADPVDGLDEARTA
ncbi:MAG: MFS transporter [Frankiaceae bacterium]